VPPNSKLVWRESMKDLNAEEGTPDGEIRVPQYTSRKVGNPVSNSSPLIAKWKWLMAFDLEKMRVSDPPKNLK